VEFVYNSLGYLNLPLLDLDLDPDHLPNHLLNLNTRHVTDNLLHLRNFDDLVNDPAAI